ncbi:hypothetical protein FPV67DRAFT_1676146 [Lyophyllum atratum]|nr:hypothetical protein FPV67DRAFT_1676146 [Lyophyllum atratum]
MKFLGPAGTTATGAVGGHPICEGPGVSADDAASQTSHGSPPGRNPALQTIGGGLTPLKDVLTVQPLEVKVAVAITWVIGWKNGVGRQSWLGDQVRKTGDVGLAHQIAILRMERGFNDQLMQRFHRLACLPGLTGSVFAGINSTSPNVVPFDAEELQMNGLDDTGEPSWQSGEGGDASQEGPQDGRSLDDGDEGGEGDEEEDAELACNVLRIVSIETRISPLQIGLCCKYI